MESRVSELLGLIREEISLYRDLIEHARRKTALLVQGSVQAILESNKVEETFNIKLRMLEDEVRRLCLELCQAFRLPREEFTLLKLAEGFEKPVAEEIKSQTSLFRNLIEQLKSVNQRNMKLIESSVRYSRTARLAGECHQFLPGDRFIQAHSRYPSNDLPSGLAGAVSKEK